MPGFVLEAFKLSVGEAEELQNQPILIRLLNGKLSAVELESASLQSGGEAGKNLAMPARDQGSQSFSLMTSPAAAGNAPANIPSFQA